MLEENSSFSMLTKIMKFFWIFHLGHRFVGDNDLSFMKILRTLERFGGLTRLESEIQLFSQTPHSPLYFL